MEGDFIKTNNWLLPLSWCYNLGVGVRNALFDMGVLKSRSFDVPVISVGNITVGGTGKTPHVEYLVELLKKSFSVAVLSRGYKRKTSGFLLADRKSTATTIGDEPYQIKQKFPEVQVAVDKNRCHGIQQLMDTTVAGDIEVVILDDAYQHRYVKPGVNILLVDYHRLIVYDKLLPAGRLRESQSGKTRADIIIVTKCPKSLKPMEFRVIHKALDPAPYQTLFFTTLEYGSLKPIYCGEDKPLDSLTPKDNVLLLTGIASPQQMIIDLEPLTKNITPMTFADHHQFTDDDITDINETFEAMPEPKLIITTEKDAVRLFGMEGLSDEVRRAIYVLPIRIKFLQEQENKFNEQIIGYVRKNSRNSIVAQTKNDHNPNNSNNPGDGTRPISF